MSRYVEITKDGNNYTVNPNAGGGDTEIALCAYEIVEGESFGNLTAGDAMYIIEDPGEGSLDGVPYSYWASNNNIKCLSYGVFSDTENFSGDEIQSYGTTIAVRNPDLDILMKSSS